jgi:DNA modification methylase
MLLDQIYNCDCVEGMKQLPDASVDLTVTSPPYDNLRTYNGFAWDFEAVARELYRVTKPGGVVVWVVADATVDFSETLTSFQQAIFFRDIGFGVETMIWDKGCFTATGALKYRYAQSFEYMFVFTKGGEPKTFNPIKDRPNRNAGMRCHGTIRTPDGGLKERWKATVIPETSQRFNVWQTPPVCSNTERTGHPAQFPEQLVRDHIISWSNPGDLVLDPFMGSGTTAKMAAMNDRHYVGFEISAEYCAIANQRVWDAKAQRRRTAP